MNLRPKRLALLISLIGGGISPCAQARVDGQRIDLAPTMPGLVCSELEAVALPACGATGDRDLIWQPQRSALDLRGAAGVLVLYGVPDEDRAPSEAPVASTLNRARPLPSEPDAIDVAAPHRTVARVEAVHAARPIVVHRRTGKARHVRVLARADGAPAAHGARLAKVDALGLERIDRIERIHVTSLPTTMPVGAGSAEVERLLATLATVLSDTPPPAQQADDLVRAGTPSNPAEPSAPGRPGAGSALSEGRASAATVVAVETQAGKVLRHLGAILSAERDEVGAIRLDSPQPTVTTHSGKVMAALGQISSAEPPVVEDGAARRLRKLAARAAKAQADAEAEADAEAAARAATANDVDVILPLELPALAALPAGRFVELPRVAWQAALPGGAAQTAIRATASASERASPFGDRRLAISEGLLDQVRGGFSGDGLNISFGIERAVYINGTLATTTTLNIGDLGKVVAGRGLTAIDPGTIALIQNGVGNSIATGSISASSIGAVIQNTLDGQKIQNITVINATANSLGLMRGMNLGSSLRGAVIDSLRR